MGIILPEEFDLRSLHNDEERSVVTSFRDRLNDGWFVIPSVQLHRVFDYELDVVLLHRDYGIFDIEVKGHRVRIEGGLWKDDRGVLDPQPMEQARRNAFRLGDLLRKRFPEELTHLVVRWGVALPNTKQIDGELPPAYTANQILLGVDLLDPIEKLQMIAAEGQVGSRLEGHHIEAVVNFLFPNVDFVWDEHTHRAHLHQRLEDLSASQIKALEPLDANRRVVVTGGAGTGKTRLACAWARRALSRDERVLFVCFNEPLADEIHSHFLTDENLKTGPFLQLARVLDGMPYLPVPELMNSSQTKQFWDVTASGHLHANWPLITERFDTVIIDEAQDFSPAWIAQLDALLDPDGPRRMMMVADAGQNVFNRGFSLPNREDGWAVCELTTNCRNSLEIAQLLRRFLLGAASPVTLPPGSGIEYHSTELEEPEGILTRILRELPPSPPAAVIVPSHQQGNHLRQHLGLGAWEDRHTKVICESVRRLKGTEFDSVILYDPDGTMDDQALYVAVSRAVSRLDLIGPVSLGRRLGLNPSGVQITHG